MHSCVTARSSAVRPTSRRSIAALWGVALALAACKGDSTAPSKPVASVAVTPKSSSVLVGERVQLTAQPLDAAGSPVGGKTITWRSVDASAATVSSGGLVTAIGPGTVTVQALADNIIGSAEFVITAPVATVLVSGNTGVLLVGGTLQLNAVPRDAAGNVLPSRPVTWTTSAPNVATVSSVGLVTGVSAGTVTITATSEGKSTATTMTAVAVPPPVASVTVTSAATALLVGGTQRLTATVFDSQGATLTNRTITWGTSNSAIARVDSTGLVTMLTTGLVRITANSEGRSGSLLLAALRALLVNVPLTIASPASLSQFFFVDVPAGTTQLIISSTGGTGDPDMYIYRAGASPQSPGAVVCASEADGPIESCTINTPTAGRWMVEMSAFTAFSGVQLRAATTP